MALQPSMQRSLDFKQISHRENSPGTLAGLELSHAHVSFLRISLQGNGYGCGCSCAHLQNSPLMLSLRKGVSNRDALKEMPDLKRSLAGADIASCSSWRN